MKRLMMLCLAMVVLPVLANDAEPLIDFTKAEAVQSWRVVTDATERDQGKSNGTLSFQDGKQAKQSFFFAFLDPQPNGAAFVSVKIDKVLALTDQDALLLEARNISGSPATFEFVLDTSDSIAGHYSYRQRFTLDDDALHTISLPLNQFEPSYRNREKLPQGVVPLSPADIRSIGLRIIGRTAPNQAGLYGLALRALSVLHQG